MNEYQAEADAKTPAATRMERAVEQANARGLVIVKPRGNELFVDLDDDKALGTFKANYERLLQVDPNMKFDQRRSPSGRPGRWHVVVTMHHAVSDVERVMLQALLGSDPVREMLGYLRARRGDPNPTLFFEKPEVANDRGKEG